MATVEELIRQNGFLADQLAQVQQDLERYYLENLQLLEHANGAPLIDEFTLRYWLQYHPRELWIDLREEPLHDNWYEAERHGRWAGPKPLTTIRIPALRPADYIAEIEIVEVITPGMLQQWICTVGGIEVKPLMEYLYPPSGFPLVVSLPFKVRSVAQPRPIDIQFAFPQAVAPSELSGSDDMRRLTACFRAVRIIDSRLHRG